VVPSVDLLLSGQLLFSALVLGAFYALVALGLNLVYGTVRLLNLAHGDLIMIGSYVGFWLFTLLGISPLIGLFLAAALTALLGAAAYYGLFRGQIDRVGSVSELEAKSLLIFFGLSVAIQNLAALAFTASPRAYQHLDQVYHVAGVAMTLNRILVLLIAVAICGGVTLFLRFNILGLAVKALIQNRVAAQVVGIDVERIQLLAICLGFGVTGVAGALLSMTEQVSPFMGLPFTIAAFIVIILGGLGNIAGGLAAGFLLGFIEIYGVALTSATYGSIILYGCFIGILLLRPQGLMGRARTTR
jgi:branched-chain amino acid transport system permease protein